MIYCERIRDLREDHHYTQQEIAERLNVVQRTYSDYESGRIRIPVESLIKLAQLYNVSLDYISGVTSVKKPYPKA